MIRIHYGYATKWLRFSFTTWSTTPNTVQFHSIATYLHRGPHRETMPAKTRASKRAGAPDSKSASPHSEEPTEVEANTADTPYFLVGGKLQPKAWLLLRPGTSRGVVSCSTS